MDEFKFVPWEQIPDLGLYMDQVITFVGRVYAPVYGPDIRGYLSPSMINNYVKGKLLAKPEGKKYSREQIALIIMIVALKQAAALEDIRALLTASEGQDAEALYTSFCRRFEGVVAGMDTRDALDCAIHAAAYRAGCVAALKAGGL